PTRKRNEAQRREIRDQLCREGIIAGGAALADRDAVRAEKQQLEAGFPQIPIMRELPADKPRETRLQVRGNLLDKAGKVEPATPGAFPAFPAGAPRDRLGFARWLVDERNPLTARVAANRHWAQLFGVGLVETEEDFGTQGTPPSHRELLDWLASELVRQGWSM